MTADHLEAEYKYALDESTVLPDFSALPGVKSVSVVDHQLLATYFDTPDLALAAAGMTLRRRTGGEDAGWHLKLPMDGGRLEIVLPLGRALRNPPVALRKVVAGVARDNGLVPVVIISTDRRVHRLHGKKGDVLAELADDRVSADHVTPEATDLLPVTWREAKVELMSGKPSLLVRVSDLMASNGARRSRSPSKLVQALGDRLPRPETTTRPGPGKKSPAADLIQLRLLTQVAALRQQDPWVRHDAPVAAHHLRVTVGRLRHALAGYRPFLDPQQTEPLRDDLDWLAGLLEATRDAEVLHDLLCGLVDDEADSLVIGPVPARIEHDFHRRYDPARADLVSAMGSVRYFDLIDRLQGLAEVPPWTDEAHKKVSRTLVKSLDDDWKRLREHVLRVADERISRPWEPGDLHDILQAVTCVRYAAEGLLPLPGKGARRMVKAHARMQTVLGDEHDVDVARAALVELSGGAASAGENAFTYGLLHARLEARAAAHATDFDQAWQDSLTARARYRTG